MSNDQETAPEQALVNSQLPPVVFSVTAEALAKLTEKNSKLTTVTAENYDMFKANKKELVSLRTGIEAERNEQLKAARQHTDDVNTEARRVTALIEEIEAPIKKLKADYDADQKAIKQEGERKERKRTDAINAKIDVIEGMGRDLDGECVDALNDIIERLHEVDMSEEEFQEFHAVAMERYESTEARLAAAKYKRIEYEREQQELAEEKDRQAAAQKEIDDEKAQLAADKAAFEKQQKAAKEKADAVVDDEKRKAQEAVDAEKQKQADEDRAAREAQIAEDAAEAERNRIAQEEEDRQAAEAEALLMAPDKVKLARYASMIESLAEEAPELGHQKAQKVLARAVTSLTQVAANLARTAGDL